MSAGKTKNNTKKKTKSHQVFACRVIPCVYVCTYSEYVVLQTVYDDGVFHTMTHPWGGFSKLDCSTTKSVPIPYRTIHTSSGSSRRDDSNPHLLWHRHHSNCGDIDHGQSAQQAGGGVRRRVRYYRMPVYMQVAVYFYCLDRIFFFVNLHSRCLLLGGKKYFEASIKI